jgi:oligopeptide transport system substrate-binding protein
MVPPMDGHTPTLELKFDPDKARALLASAGYPEGKGFPETTLLFNTDENHKQIAERIQDMWKRELGITLKLENKEWKTYLGDVDKLSYQIARAGWIGDYNDPTTFLGIFTTGNGNNDTGWGSPEYDKLINGAYAEVDMGKRAEMLKKAEQILIEEAPVIPIMFYQQATLINPRLLGHKPHNRDIHLVKYMDIK